MHFINAAFGALALATAVVAQSTSLYFTTLPGSVTAGQTYSVSYYAADETDPVTILLRKGPSTNLQTVSTLTSTTTGGTYQWTVDSTLPAGSDYALEITQGDEVNYSGQFSLSSSVSAVSSTMSTTVAASSSLVVVSSSSMLSVSASSSILTAAASLSSAYSSVVASVNSSLVVVGSGNATITSTFPIMTPPSNLTMTTPSNMSTTPAYGTPTSTVTATAGGAGATGGSGSSGAAGASSYPGPMSGAGAAFLVSPVAIVVGVVAAFAYLN